MREMLATLRTLFLIAVFAPAAMAQGFFTASQSSFNLQATDDQNPFPQTLMVNRFISGIIGTVEVPIDFTISANVPWITFNPNTGTTPRTVTVTFQPRNLPGGANAAVITVASAVPNGPAPLLISVTLNVGAIVVTAPPPTPACFATPTTDPFVCFYYHVSVPPTADFRTSETLQVSGPSNFNVAFTALTGGAWLSAVRQGSAINVAGQRLGLAPTVTPYLGRITVSATGYLPKIVDVAFIVEGDARLAAAPITSTTDLTRGVHPFRSIAVTTISNAGFGGFNHQLDFTYAISYGAGLSGWLSGQANGSRTAARIDLTADTRNLPLGINGASIQFLDSRGQQAALIEVYVNVVATTLTASPPSLNLTLGGAPGQVGISTNGPTLNYTAAADKPWVQVSPASDIVGSTVKLLTVTLLPSLPPGPQTATLTITTTNGPSTTVAINASGGAVTLTTTVDTLTLVLGGAPGVVGISINGPPVAFSTQVDKPWVQVTSPGATVSTAVVNLTVTLLGSIPPGPQTATLTITATGAPSKTVAINASGGAAGPDLTVSTSALSLILGGAPGEVRVSTNGPARPFNAAIDKPWARVSPESGTATSTPQTLTVTLLPSLPAGPQTANLTITAGTASTVVVLNATGGAGAVTSRRIVVPQVADGGNWKTTVVVLSNDTVAASFTLRFFSATGQPQALPVAGRGMTAEVPGNVAAGGFQVIETEGTAAELVQGWAEIATDNRLAGYAIFRQRLEKQDAEGVVPIPSTGGRRLLIPFDNTNRFITSVAIANPDAAPCENGFARFNDENGSRFLDAPLPLSGRNRRAFRLIDEFAATVNRRGVAEFTCANVDVFLVGFRFNPDGAFTSVDPVDPSATLAPRRIVPQVADGRGWKTTAIVENLDTVEAQVTINFFGANGAAFAVPGLGAVVTRRIPPGGLTVVESAGTSAALEQGWAEIVSAQKVAGTAVFRQRGDVLSEGTVALPTTGGRRLLLYFDNQSDFNTSLAVANPDGVQTVVNARFLDSNGVPFGSGPMTIAGRTRDAFELKERFPVTDRRRGVIELTSSSADVYVVVLRFNLSSFTSLAPVAP